MEGLSSRHPFWKPMYPRAASGARRISVSAQEAEAFFYDETLKGTFVDSRKVVAEMCVSTLILTLQPQPLCDTPRPLPEVRLMKTRCNEARVSI